VKKYAQHSAFLVATSVSLRRSYKWQLAPAEGHFAGAGTGKVSSVFRGCIENAPRSGRLSGIAAIWIAAVLIAFGSAASSREQGRESPSGAQPSRATLAQTSVESSPPKEAGGEQNMAGDFLEVLLK
jgi:hypothetical protein